MPKLTTTSGLELAYEEQGDGPPVVMIMGLGAQLVLWPQELVDAIAGAGFRAVRFDNRDIGQSAWFDHLGVPNNAKLLARRLAGLSVEAPYTLSAMASDTVGLLDALGIDRAHLVGASLGGMIAQTVAIEHPNRVVSLTSIMSSAGNLAAFAVHPRALKQMLGKPPRNREEYVDRIVTLFRRHAGTHPYDHVRMAELAGQQYDRGYHPQGFARQFAAILASGSRVDRLKTVKTPTTQDWPPCRISCCWMLPCRSSPGWKPPASFAAIPPFPANSRWCCSATMNRAPSCWKPPASPHASPRTTVQRNSWSGWWIGSATGPAGRTSSRVSAPIVGGVPTPRS